MKDKGYPDEVQEIAQFLNDINDKIENISLKSKSKQI